MNAAEHYREAERLLADVTDGVLPDSEGVPLAQAHGILALVATLTPRAPRPAPDSTARKKAKEAWNQVARGPRFDDLDREMQAALATRWQARHG